GTVPPPPKEESSELPVLVSWSTRTVSSGESYAAKLANYLKQNPATPMDALGYTLATTRESLTHRYTIVAGNIAELTDQLRDSQWQHHELTEQLSQLVFLFPGQGAQYPGMGYQLYQREAIFRKAVDDCAEILIHETGEDFRKTLFPESDESPEKTAQALRNTYYTQPALFIISY